MIDRELLGGTYQGFPSWVVIGEGFDVGEGTVIGSEGFGYEKENGEWQRREHRFGVRIGRDVSIGANTVIDRGRYRDTVIGSGTKIDNLVHIAHNVQIGKRCLIIAHAMIAGSAEIGDDVWIGPGAQISDHVKIGDGARIGLGAVVLRDVPAGETWVGNPAKRLRSKDQAGGLQRLTQLLDLDHAGVEWRHDVDYSIECAIRMAHFEAERAIRSTYYLMPRTESYIVTRSTVDLFTRLGHEIGTHVDLHAPRDATFTTVDLHRACVRDWELLRQIGWDRISRKVSFHQPPRDVIGRDIPQFDSAQGSRWQGRWISDSRGVFSDSPEERLRDRSQEILVNLHPEWWFLPPEEADALRRVEALAP